MYGLLGLLKVGRRNQDCHMANAEHKDEWITAAEAVRLLKPIFESGYSAKMTICSRAHAGLIRAQIAGLPSEKLSSVGVNVMGAYR